MGSTRAELMGAYAVLHKVRQWKGTVGIWVDNDNGEVDGGEAGGRKA